MRIGRIPLAMISPPDPTGAEVLRQMLSTVLYAEMRAIFLAWAGIRGWDPVTHAWSTVRRALHECLRPGMPEFLERAYAILREDSALALEPALRRGGPQPYDADIGHGQVGSSQGLEETFHEAGLVSVFHRAEDQRVLSVAIRLADFALSYPIRSGQA